MTTFKNLEIIKATLLEKKEATGKLVAVLNQEAKDERKQLFETIFGICGCLVHDVVMQVFLFNLRWVHDDWRKVACTIFALEELTVLSHVL